jgi:uncharacterized MAPEG superfamily protein
VTIAYWCVLAAALLPLLYTGIAKFSGPGFNNYKPRDFQASLSGYRQRAHWAHLNSLEAFPPFAAAVIIAEQLAAPQAWVDGLALAFIGCRLAYGALYIANQATWRSVVWAAGLGCVIGLFVVSA